MKRLTALVLSVLFLVSLTACGEAGHRDDEAAGGPHVVENEPPSDSSTQPGGERFSDPSERAPDEPDPPVISRKPGWKPTGQDPKDGDPDVEHDQVPAAGDAYAALIEQFRAIAANPDGDWDMDEPGVTGLWEESSSLAYGDISPLEALGYAVADLSGDGVPELAVASLPEYGGEISPFGPHGGHVFVLYTLVDGQPQYVFEGWHRNSYAYIGEGCFFCYGSSSAAETCLGFYALSEDGTALEVENFYFTGPEDENGDIAIYRNTSGSFDPVQSQKTEMTLGDFWALAPEPQDLPLTPFSALDAGGAGGNAPPTAEEAMELLVTDTDVAYWMEQGMKLMETGDSETLFGEECTLIALGTGHEDSFVREQLFAVSASGAVYRYDVVMDQWDACNTPVRLHDGGA